MLVINPQAGCHFFLLGPHLPSQLQDDNKHQCSDTIYWMGENRRYMYEHTELLDYCYIW